jgi:hypothetical protein
MRGSLRQTAELHERFAVAVSKTHARPGQFALQRFRTRRRVWRRRIWWVLAMVGAAEVAIVAILGAALQPEHFELYLGIGLGIAVTMTMVFFDSPPHHIERWRQGAEGEQATARALRRLVSDGWTLVHDVEIGHGNLDHILVGPPGVFLLETKKLHGAMTVERGVLSVRWREDPTDGYDNVQLAPRMRARAAELSAAPRSQGIDRVWVQPTVVLWGAFEQRSIQSDGVAWIDGRALAAVLLARPTALTPDRIREATSALERWLNAMTQNARAA